MLTVEDITHLPSYGKNKSDVIALFKKEEIPVSPTSNDEENASMMSNHEDAERVSLLDVITIFSSKSTNFSDSFSKFSK